ncbi:MAG TPA: hypothetical protein VLB50_06750 [Ignavibacteriaceae bacterium]|nr:hypothetical protein [Ignavibacteriaceae bacterium]
MHKNFLLCIRAGYLIAICLLSLSVFPSCSGNPPDTSLIQIKDGLICTIYNGKPYTGKVSDVINQQKVEYDVVKGIKDGNFNVFSEQGIKVISGEMRNNKNEGLWQYFYPGGQLESQGYFKNDNLNYKWYWYFPDGKLKTTGEYLNGKKYGKWTDYDESGKVISEEVYRNNEVVANMKDLSA